uniref:Uncharacterized protein n=1 Tax=Setaria digitata TaxID=48799 RepID=A0A915Q6P8_9BILA
MKGDKENRSVTKFLIIKHERGDCDDYDDDGGAAMMILVTVIGSHDTDNSVDNYDIRNANIVKY